MVFKQVDPFYKTKRWRKKRAASFRKHEYLCQETRRFGLDEDAEVLHHIYPREQYPELEWEDWNLLPVTNKKHNTFHNRDDNTITAKGKYWQRKREREFNAFYAERGESYV